MVERVLGITELRKVLEKLPAAAQKRVISGGVRRAANTFRKAMREGAPVGKEDPHPKYGRLKDNIKVVRVRSAKRTEVRFSATVGRAFWAAFLEYGTSRQAAKPFVRPAFDNNADRALRGMVETIGKGIEREAAKLVGAHKVRRK